MTNKHLVTISFDEDPGNLSIEVNADIKRLGTELSNAAKADKKVLMALSSVFALVSASLELATGKSLTKKSPEKKSKK
jgi:hypothetical protein